MPLPESACTVSRPKGVPKAHDGLYQLLIMAQKLWETPNHYYRYLTRLKKDGKEKTAGTISTGACLSSQYSCSSLTAVHACKASPPGRQHGLRITAPFKRPHPPRWAAGLTPVLRAVHAQSRHRPPQCHHLPVRHNPSPLHIAPSTHPKTTKAEPFTLPTDSLQLGTISRKYACPSGRLWTHSRGHTTANRFHPLPRSNTAPTGSPRAGTPSPALRRPTTTQFPLHPAKPGAAELPTPPHAERTCR